MTYIGSLGVYDAMSIEKHEEPGTSSCDRRWNLFDLVYWILGIFVSGFAARWCGFHFGPFAGLIAVASALGVWFLLWFKWGFFINRRRKKW
jgi:hypothetical protein